MMRTLVIEPAKSFAGPIDCPALFSRSSVESMISSLGSRRGLVASYY
jgi:hypothetical protein